jgi:hypothetical protein
MIGWFRNLSENWQIAIFGAFVTFFCVLLFELSKWLFVYIARITRGKKIYLWLKNNTKDKAGLQFKSTNEISQALGIVENQVREACTLNNRIYLCSDKKDLWGIYSDKPSSVYEERGLLDV